MAAMTSGENALFILVLQFIKHEIKYPMIGIKFGLIFLKVANFAKTVYCML